MTFTYNIFINITAPRLWEALTSKELSSQYWSGRHILSEWKVGSRVSLIQKDGTSNWEGKILSYEPYTTLSYTFDVSVDPRVHGINAKHSRFLADEPVSKVTFKLESVGDATLLTIFHEDLSEVVEEVVCMSWAHVASSLKSVLETGKPLATPDI